MTLAVRLARAAPLFADAQSANLGFFSESERQRYESFTAVARRQQFVASRWLARQLLTDCLGGSPADWQLSAESGAAPQVLGTRDTPLYLSLSHSGSWIACAIATQPLGLDLEVSSRPRSHLAALARKVCTPAEQHELEALAPPEQLAAFYRMWTLKEAWLKQHGLGIDFSHMRGLEVTEIKPDQIPNALTLSTLEGGLSLAIAARSLAEPLRLDTKELSFQVRRWRLST